VAGGLTIVGTGIRLVGQMTLEALDHIKRAEHLLYLAGDPATAIWLRQLNATAEDLSDCYAEGTPRPVSYGRMADRIMARVGAGRRVVAAFYGHPGVGVDPARAALARARAAGYPARMLPGISAEACLLADLGVDPLVRGWQSYEAWSFIADPPTFDSSRPLVLWQIGLVYDASIRFAGTPNRRGLASVKRALSRHYKPRHTVVLYDASPFPVCDARVERIPLAELSRADVRLSTTLYVPGR